MILQVRLTSGSGFSYLKREKNSILVRADDPLAKGLINANLLEPEDLVYHLLQTARGLEQSGELVVDPIGNRWEENEFSDNLI